MEHDVSLRQKVLSLTLIRMKRGVRCGRGRVRPLNLRGIFSFPASGAHDGEKKHEQLNNVEVKIQGGKNVLLGREGISEAKKKDK